MPDGPSVAESAIVDAPVKLEDMRIAPTEILSPANEIASTLPDEEGLTTLPVEPELLDGHVRTIDDLKATLAQMKNGVSGPLSQKEDAQDYKPEKPVGKIRKFLKRHPVLAPFMAPLAGLAALMMLMARSAFKSSKERQGQ